MILFPIESPYHIPHTIKNRRRAKEHAEHDEPRHGVGRRYNRTVISMLARVLGQATPPPLDSKTSTGDDSYRGPAIKQKPLLRSIFLQHVL